MSDGDFVHEESKEEKHPHEEQSDSDRLGDYGDHCTDNEDDYNESEVNSGQHPQTVFYKEDSDDYEADLDKKDDKKDGKKDDKKYVKKDDKKDDKKNGKKDGKKVVA